jgi:ferredoxin-NADP reductase
MSLGLNIGGNHLYFHVEVDGEEVMRKYTPISEVRNPGFADFLIKIYRPGESEEFPKGGKVTPLLEAMQPGSTIWASGPIEKFSYFGYGQCMRPKDDVPIIRKKIGGIAGGSGISPIYPVLMHGLRYEDGVEFSLIFGNKTVKDVLLKDELV